MTKSLENNNNLTPNRSPNPARKKITPPPSPYIARHRSALTDPISINITSPKGGNVFNFDNVPITPKTKRVQQLAVRPKSEDKIQKILIKNLKQESQDALDELIDTKGQLNMERAKNEELTKDIEKLKAKIAEMEEDKKRLEFELQFSMTQLAENDEEIKTLKSKAAAKTPMTLKAKRKSVLFNVSVNKNPVRKSMKAAKKRSSMGLNATLKVKSNAAAPPNFSKMLAEERTKVEELTKELKKYREDSIQFKAAPMPRCPSASVKPTKTTLLRQSLRMKK